MNKYKDITRFSFFLLILNLMVLFMLCEDIENYKTYTLEGEENNYLLDVTDYHNLSLLVSTSKKIYTGIPLTYKTTTNANLNNCSSVATVNENYILVTCLDDYLLGYININTGSFKNLLNYSEINVSPELTVPKTICSIRISENMAIIGYNQLDTENGNKTFILIKVDIKINDVNEPEIDTSNEEIKFYKDFSVFRTNTLRQIVCDTINMIDIPERLIFICIYDSYDESGKYAIFSQLISENFEQENNKVRIWRYSSESGFRVQKINSFYIRSIIKDKVHNIYTEYEGYSEKAYTRTINLSDKLALSVAKKDLFDYNNNFIFTSSYGVLSNMNYYNFSIITGNNTYYKIYKYNKDSVKKLIGFYDSTTGNIIIIFQLSSSIKYIIINNYNDICQIDNYSGILKIQTSDTTVYNLQNFFEYYTNFNNIQFEEIIIYEYKTNINFNNYTFIAQSSSHYNIYYLSNTDFFIKECLKESVSCTNNFYKCDTSCETESQNNYCLLNDKIEGYIYNSNSKIFETCYDSCKFCSKKKDESSTSAHNCEACADGYIPSYKYLGNCYKGEDNNPVKIIANINDENFTIIDSCPKYKINLTGECVEECPTSTEYYDFSYSSLNFSKFTNNKIIIEHYEKNINTIDPPKYLFNNVCYVTCPTLTSSDDTNICKCMYAFHIENELTICHKENHCIDNTYKYYINDTKECKSGNSCPDEYYQFNFICYKNGCPSDTEVDTTNSYKCNSKYKYCYINEYFQNICGNSPYENYIYKYDDTVQYLKNCEESLIYTTLESKTYFYNNTCYVNCPEYTIQNDTINRCECKYFGYYPDNNNYECYYEEEICKDKIPVFELNICLNNIEECKTKNYKIFNNNCYLNECPENTKLDNDNYTCICSYSYYNFINNNTLDCFENTISCQDKNYSYYNPNSLECYISLDDCFNKNNQYYFNNECYKEDCPSGKIKLTSTNEKIQKYFIQDLSLNDNLKNKICICDINTDIKWNKTENNEIECLTTCGDEYEEENLTHKCVEKCNPIKHYSFNDECFKEECPNGTKLNSTENERKICVCEDLYYINETTNYMICCNQDNIELCLKIQTTIITTEPLITLPPTTQPIETISPTTQPFEAITPTTQPIEIISPTTQLFEALPPTTQPIIPPTTQLFEPMPLTTQPIIPPSTQPIGTIPPTTNALAPISQFTQTLKTNIYTTFPQYTESQTIISSIKIQSTFPSTIELEKTEFLKSDSYKNELKITESLAQELFNSSYIYEYEETDSNIISDKNSINSDFPKNFDDCKAIYDNKCYSICEEGTCYTQSDIDLNLCVPINSSIIVFNYICFVNFDEIINDLKNVSENNPIIKTHPNVTIHVYTTQTALNKSLIYTNLSFIFLNECESILRKYYNLSNDTNIYIVGIDSPNKNKSYVVNVYNYGVYLENGFQLDHINICKDVVVTISSPIINTDSIKLNDGYYFSLFGYDIYDKNDIFYTDYCSPASINKKDIILSDRIKDFYPDNYSLCNNSCNYYYTNYNEERILCFCNLTYNFSDNYTYIEYNKTIEKEDISYLDYFLSLINYKIITCYKLLLIWKNYIHNIGFYIAGITIVICLIEMFIFMTYGIKNLKEHIFINIPNNNKLKSKLEERNKNDKYQKRIAFKK